MYWLEKVESGQINVAKIIPALPRLSSRRGENQSDVPSLPPTVVDIDLAKPSTAATTKSVTRDRYYVQDSLEGKNKVTEASFSYFESIQTGEIVRNGFFGTVCRGSGSFTVKAINTDLRRYGELADDNKAKETFLMEIEVR